MVGSRDTNPVAAVYRGRTPGDVPDLDLYGVPRTAEAVSGPTRRTGCPATLYRMTASLPDTSIQVRPGALTRTLRVVVVIGTLAVLTQSVLAGQILSHTAGARNVHGLVALVVALISIVQLVLALIAWRRRSASGLVALLCAVVLVAVVGEIFAGATETLAVHVPLGVALFGGSVWLLREVWRA